MNTWESDTAIVLELDPGLAELMTDPMSVFRESVDRWTNVGADIPEIDIVWADAELCPRSGKKPDGHNVVCSDPTLIGRTWVISLRGEIVESDISIGLEGGYDPRTVVLHEMGHLLGLGQHVAGTAMRSSAHPAEHLELTSTDAERLLTLYPAESSAHTASDADAGLVVLETEGVLPLPTYNAVDGGTIAVNDGTVGSAGCSLSPSCADGQVGWTLVALLTVTLGRRVLACRTVSRRN